VVALVLVFVGVSAAAPSGDVKSSPLFKRSLEESIASLEGKALQANGAKGEAEALPTGKPGCDRQPDAPYTSYGNTCSETCSPTQCGGECYTQANTCYPTACGGTCYETCSYTCASTCGNTCSGATCSSTCAGGSCQYHYIWKGKNWWNYTGNKGTNWYDFLNIYSGAECTNGGWTEVRFVGSNPPPNETDPYWSPNDGIFNIDKWYSSPITNEFDIQSWVQLKVFCSDPSWINYASIVLQVHNPPNDYGTWHVIDFYFYD
jgi:hypothetical protein